MLHLHNFIRLIRAETATAIHFCRKKRKNAENAEKSHKKANARL